MNQKIEFHIHTHMHTRYKKVEPAHRFTVLSQYHVSCFYFSSYSMTSDDDQNWTSDALISLILEPLKNITSQ